MSGLPPTEFCLMAADPPSGYDPVTVKYYTADPKLGPVQPTYPEVQLVWQAEALRECRSCAGSPPAPSRSRTATTSRTPPSATRTCLQTGYRHPV